MKAVLVGAGGFGYRWYETLREFHGDLQLAVVDVDEGKRSRIEKDGVPFYTSALEAIERERPDMLLNFTPKERHAAIDHLAFDHKLPVFSEKPIADNYRDAVEVVERAARENIPFMIGENYRAFVFSRRIKQLIDRGAIGGIVAIHGEFNRYSDRGGRDAENREGILEELVVHHFDLLRYWTGREAERIFASYSHHLLIWMGMQDGVTASFRCMSSAGRQTDWAGNWRIDGTLGSLELIDNQVLLTVDGKTTAADDDFKETYAPGPFSEFLLSIALKREAETSGSRYLHNQALAHFARESIRTCRPIDIASSREVAP